MACAVFLTYPLQAYPAIEVLLPLVQKRFPERLAIIVESVFRYCLVAITCKQIQYIQYIQILMEFIHRIYI